MHGWEVITELVILLSVATLLGVVAERVGLSAIIGAIIGGMLVGPAALGWVEGDHLEVSYVAEFGVALLLFAIGLEVTRDKLLAFGLPGARVGILQIVLTMVVFGLGSLVVGWGWAAAFAIGSMIAMSSTAAVARTLTDSGQLEAPHGRTAMAVLLMQDLAIVPLAVVLSLMGGPTDVEEVASRLGMAGAQMIVAMLLIGLCAILLVPRLLHSSHLSGNRELPVVLAVVTGVLAAWLSHELGLSAATGAFIAGLCLANSPFARQIRSDVTAIKAIFLTIFFASIGTLADLTWFAAPDRLGLILLVAGVVIGGKLLLASAATWISGVRVGSIFAVGLCVAQVGEFSFVLGGLARNQGLLSQDTLDVFLAAATVTLLLVPPLIGLASRLSGMRRTQSHGSASQEAHVVLIGLGPSAQESLAYLRASHVPITVIDFNSRAVTDLVESGCGGFVGDARRPDLLRSAGVDRASAVLVTVPDPLTSIRLIEQVRLLAPTVPIVVRCRYNRSRPQLEAAGANTIVLEEDAVGVVLGDALATHLELVRQE